MRLSGLVLVVVLLTVDPGQGFTPERVLVRDKRTIHFLINHFSQFFGLSGNPVKGATPANEKQDNSNPLAQILLSSAGKFSGGSGGAKKSSTPKPFVAQFEIPSPERLIQEPSENDGPSRVPLLDSEPSSTTTTTTTTTEEPAQEPSTEAPAPASSEEPATDAPEEAPEAPSTDSEPDAEAPTTIDPAAVNTLANGDAPDNRDDSTTQTDDSAPQTPSASQQPQQFRRPAWSPFGATSYTNQPVPFTSYFGNNVFLPAPFIPQPFSHFGQYQPQQIPVQPIQYHSGHHPNLIPAASATSHSRVKMHDAPFDLVTFHGDSNGAGSSSYYHVRKY